MYSVGSIEDINANYTIKQSYWACFGLYPFKSIYIIKAPQLTITCKPKQTTPESDLIVSGYSAIYDIKYFVASIHTSKLKERVHL
jgi:hypothetical protein